MNLQEIKKAVEDGKVVCLGNSGYRVLKDDIGQWFIISYLNGYHAIGLTHEDGVTLNGREEDFYIQPEVRGSIYS